MLAHLLSKFPRGSPELGLGLKPMIGFVFLDAGFWFWVPSPNKTQEPGILSPPCTVICVDLPYGCYSRVGILATSHVGGIVEMLITMKHSAGGDHPLSPGFGHPLETLLTVSQPKILSAQNTCLHESPMRNDRSRTRTCNRWIRISRLGRLVPQEEKCLVPQNPQFPGCLEPYLVPVLGPDLPSPGFLRNV